VPNAKSNNGENTMSKKEKGPNKYYNSETGKISRREFIKNTGLIAGGTTIAAGIINPFGGSKRVEAKNFKSVRPANEKWAFEVPPSSIPKSHIRQVIDSDVVVIGAGIGGLAAALSAAQAGAKTILIEKGNKITVHGGWNAAVGSRLQKKLGIEIEKFELIEEFMRWGAYKPKHEIIKLWVEKSGEVMDWVMDMTEAQGITTIIEPVARTDGPYKRYKTAHLFVKKGDPSPLNTHLLSPMKDNAIKSGAKILFKTSAQQLIRKESGRVTGVIAETAQGYKQFNAKAVILCTGGYQNNPEMLAKYIPEALNVVANWTFPRNMTGDGHQMAMWIGAAMEDAPHCPMLWDGGIPDAFMYPLTRQPFLNVNIFGERFVNEDAPFGYTARADLRQSEHMKWVVWDNKWEEDSRRFNGDACERMEGPMTFHNPGAIESLIKRGIILKENTLEALSKKMNVPPDAFMSTIRRYNRLAGLKKDLDFGKPSYMLTAIEKAPFYAVKTGACLVVTSSGLEINTRLQVLDKDRKVIPGLYAAGDVSGGFFANDYPNVLGTANSRALTFGRLAGLNSSLDKT
jgi:fumarate reductase flavoprotein subunit